METKVELAVDATKVVFYCGACEAMCEAVPPPRLPSFYVKCFRCQRFCGPFDQDKRLQHLAQLALDAAAPAKVREQEAVPLQLPPGSPPLQLPRPPVPSPAVQQKQQPTALVPAPSDPRSTTRLESAAPAKQRRLLPMVRARVQSIDAFILVAVVQAGGELFGHIGMLCGVCKERGSHVLIVTYPLASAWLPAHLEGKTWRRLSDSPILVDVGGEMCDCSIFNFDPVDMYATVRVHHTDSYMTISLLHHKWTWPDLSSFAKCLPSPTRTIFPPPTTTTSKIDTFRSLPRF